MHGCKDMRNPRVERGKKANPERIAIPRYGMGRSSAAHSSTSLIGAGVFSLHLSTKRQGLGLMGQQGKHPSYSHVISRSLL